MAEVPAPEEDEPDVQVIEDGYFEEEFHLDADAVGEFLGNLAEQFTESDEIVISGEDWEIPFPYAEPIELEIDFAGNGDRELEIELEFDGRVESDEVPEIS